MNNTPVRTRQDYKTALHKISKLMALEPDLGTPEGGKLDSLVTHVQAYESETPQTPNPYNHCAA